MNNLERQIAIMKWNIIKALSVIIITFFFFGFSYSDQNQVFEYKNGNQSVTLILISENAYLVLNQPTKIRVKLVNVSAENLTFSGRGLQADNVLEMNTKVTLTVTPNKKSVVNGNWEMNITENENGQQKWQHKFLIPVR